MKTIRIITAILLNVSLFLYFIIFLLNLVCFLYDCINSERLSEVSHLLIIIVGLLYFFSTIICLLSLSKKKFCHDLHDIYRGLLLFHPLTGVLVYSLKEFETGSFLSKNEAIYFFYLVKKWSILCILISIGSFALSANDYSILLTALLFVSILSSHFFLEIGILLHILGKSTSEIFSKGHNKYFFFFQPIWAYSDFIKENIENTR